MVVDDERLVRWSISNGLKKDAHEVSTARDANEALQKAENQPFDVVIVDYRMPGMNGIELLQILKQRCPHTKVIMLTAYKRELDPQLIVDMGAWECLEKPFVVDEIRKIVNAALAANGMCA